MMKKKVIPFAQHTFLPLCDFVWRRHVALHSRSRRLLKGRVHAEECCCCSDTSLTGEPNFIGSVGSSPGCKPRREANSWPTGPVRLCNGVKLQGLDRASSSNFTGALTCHCIAKRRTCKERNGTLEGMWCVIKSAFHIIGAKPSKAPTKGDEAAGFLHHLRQA
jgi:hypothetical protein